jgi:hypothetical protein
MRYYYLTVENVITQKVDAAQKPANPTPEKGRWMILVKDNIPSFNPQTQVLVPDVSFSETEIRVQYSVRTKTANELALEQQIADAQETRATAKSDAFVQQFIAMTPADVSEYVETHVTTLADAKTLLSKLALMLLFIAKETYRD